MEIKCRDCGKMLEVPEYGDYGQFVEFDSGLYGCDSGCEFLRFNVKCSCGFEYFHGEFGYYDSEEQYNEEIEEFIQEYNNGRKSNEW